MLSLNKFPKKLFQGYPHLRVLLKWALFKGPLERGQTLNRMPPVVLSLAFKLLSFLVLHNFSKEFVEYQNLLINIFSSILYLCFCMCKPRFYFFYLVQK